MSSIYITANEVDLILMSEHPPSNAAGLAVGNGKAFRRDVYDETVKSLRQPTSDPIHTASRQKLANALRFEEDTVKISIIAASEMLNERVAEELTQVFRTSEQSCNQVVEQQKKKTAAVAEWFQDIFLGRKPKNPDRSETRKFLDMLGFGAAESGEAKLPAKYTAP